MPRRKKKVDYLRHRWNFNYKTGWVCLRRGCVYEIPQEGKRRRDTMRMPISLDPKCRQKRAKGES